MSGRIREPDCAVNGAMENKPMPAGEDYIGQVAKACAPNPRLTIERVRGGFIITHGFDRQEVATGALEMLDAIRRLFEL